MANKIRNSLLGAAMAASSSVAAAGTPYAGLDAGATFARSNDVDETVTYSTSTGVPPSETIFYDDVFAADYDQGYDIGLVLGYDLGWLRLEAEIAQKRVGIKRLTEDDITGPFLAELNERLLRSHSDAGATDDPLTIADFQTSGALKARSAMLNGFLESNLPGKVTLSGGGGIGRSFVTGFGGKDQALAWQYLIGLRTKVADRTSIGIKYRYFNSGIVKLENDPKSYAGTSLPGQTATQNAAVAPDIEGKLRTRSLQLGVTFELR